MPPSLKYAALLSVLLALSALACGDGTAPDPPAISPQELQIVAGDGQMAATGTAVAAPLRVRVIGSDDQPLAGATVRWSITMGQATLAPSQSTTNASGDAETQVTLGTTVGPVGVRATVANLTPVTFSITAVDPSSPLRFASVSADALHNCGITTTDGPYCWGLNTYGELGDGSTTDRLTPVAVAGGGSLVAVATGVRHSCGLTVTGTASCWGANVVGEIGDGTTTQRNAPVPVAGDLSFTQLSAGLGSTCGVTGSGTAYCWGLGHTGQLGNGSTTDRRTPVPVAGGVSFASISVGGVVPPFFLDLNGTHTCAVTAPGAAYCWGVNEYGGLGDGTTTDRLTPVPVAGGISFTSVTVGFRHTCGLTVEGSSYCWGLGHTGQLGDGTTNDRWTPTRVAGGVSLTSLSTGGFHTCGLTAEGAAYCWGSNLYGQLGDGTAPIQREAPVAVAGGLSFAGISAGGHHTCAVTADGVAYCWGFNDDGRLGIGTMTHQHTPAPVVQ